MDDPEFTRAQQRRAGAERRARNEAALSARILAALSTRPRAWLTTGDVVLALGASDAGTVRRVLFRMAAEGAVTTRSLPIDVVSGRGGRSRYAIAAQCWQARRPIDPDTRIK